MPELSHIDPPDERPACPCPVCNHADEDHLPEMRRASCLTRMPAGMTQANKGIGSKPCSPC